MASSDDRFEIAFFDVETTVPTRPGQGFAILEFGSILVCPRKLVELESYSTLVRPRDLSLITSLSTRCNGISRDAVVSAPSFRDIADRVYDILHGRIWAGHNILRFDCVRIREAFAGIGRPSPEPKGTIDSLALLTQRFGRRAGNMKMATLAAYFGLGTQTHRSLDDVRMNLEVLKYCATVLFLAGLIFAAMLYFFDNLDKESSLPDILTENSWVSPNAMTRSRSNGEPSPKRTSPNVNTPAYENGLVSSSTAQAMVENHPISSRIARCREEVPNLVETNTCHPDPFIMTTLNQAITIEPRQGDDNMEEKTIQESPSVSSAPSVGNCNGSSAEFLDPDEVSIPSISASLVPMYHGSQKMKILHKDDSLQLQCTRLKVRFGISTKFLDPAGRPRLNFVVEATPSLCTVLESGDGIAQKLSLDSGSGSEWIPVVSRNNCFFNYPTVRIRIPTAVCGEIAIYATEIYQKENSGSVQRLVFSKFDASELNALFTPGTFVDAYFSLDPYDYQQKAGIRLVAKKLILHSYG